MCGEFRFESSGMDLLIEMRLNQLSPTQPDIILTPLLAKINLRYYASSNYGDKCGFRVLFYGPVYFLCISDLHDPLLCRFTFQHPVCWMVFIHNIFLALELSSTIPLAWD